MKCINTNAMFGRVIFSVLFGFVTLISGQAFAQVKASLAQQSYFQGDVITLKIESDKNLRGEPDLSPLSGVFNVTGSSANSQVSIINGTRSYKKTWNIELQAKTTGQFVIPEIQLGNETTEALKISIKELPPEIAAETKKHIFLEAAVDIKNAEIYVQQQIPYTVKFFYDVAMQTGEVILPTIEDANIRIVGKEKKYQVDRAGTNYVVVERRYVISPEKSGELVIPPTIVQGRIALTNGDSPQLRKRMNEVDMLNELFFDLNSNSSFNNPFDPFFSRRSIGPTRPYTAKSEEIQVSVLPVPDSFTGSAWLPAEEIKMEDSWTTNPPNLKVGEPVTRSIVMQVKGLGSSQIPEIFIPKPAGVKVYPEQVQTDTPNDGNTIYGIQRVDITYIPDKSGKVIIPEINVDWWDVNNKQQQTYTLPEWNLNIATGTLQESDVNVEPEVMDDINPESESTVEEVFATIPNYWGWEVLLSLIALIVILLGSITLIGKRFRKSPKQTLKKKKRKALVNQRALKKSLLQACNNNENKVAADLLIKHSALLSPEDDIQSLGAVAKNITQGQEVVKELENNLYAAVSYSDSGLKTEHWQGQKLHKLVSDGLQFKSINEAPTSFGLAPLYPN